MNDYKMNIGHLTFEPTTDVVRNERYLLINNHYVPRYTYARFKNRIHSNGLWLVWVKATTFYMNQELHYESYEPLIYLFTESPHETIYRLVSKKKDIQNAMEHRALLQVLRRVVGDETFLW
jgi:hypothetical protein